MVWRVSSLVRVAFTAAFVLAIVAACSRDGDDGVQKTQGLPPSGQAEPQSGSNGTPGGTEKDPTPTKTKSGVNQPNADQPELDNLAYLMSVADQPSGAIALGDYYFRRDQLDEAAAQYRKALAMEPNNTTAMNALAIALRKSGDSTEAKNLLLQASMVEPMRAETHINLGNVYFSEEDYKKAIASYTLATRIDTLNYQALVNLGMAYEKTEELNPALEAYVKATRADDQAALPWEQIGSIYYGKGLYRDALDRWQRAYSLDPSRSYLKDQIDQLYHWMDTRGLLQEGQ